MIKSYIHTKIKRNSLVKGGLLRYRFYKRQFSYERKPIQSIVILYYIPTSNRTKLDNWKDGFTEGIALYKQSYKITWINLALENPTAIDLNAFDFILAKSCWHWIVDKYLQDLRDIQVPRGIVVSCSKAPKNKEAAFFYDIVYYQTPWYKKLIRFHPNIIQAFGINASDFYPLDVDKDIDYLGIGLLTAYKRFHYFKSKQGRKVIVGAHTAKDSLDIKKDLEHEDVAFINYVSQDELNLLINRSKKVYIPCEIDGGGERAVLESRSAGVPVIVENDNPKLKGLLDVPLWTHHHYGNQIFKGIKSLRANTRVSHN